MKRTVLTGLGILVFLAFAGGAFADEVGKLNPKVGDQLFVCGCGEGCGCETMAVKEGKCSCGKPLVKGTVTKLEDGKAMIKTEKEERLFKTVGLYACACGEGCECKLISQQDGKCTCGKPLKMVESRKQ